MPKLLKTGSSGANSVFMKWKTFSESFRSNCRVVTFIVNCGDLSFMTPCCNVNRELCADPSFGHSLPRYADKHGSR